MPSTARRVAWPVGLVSILLILGHVVFMFLDRHGPLPSDVTPRSLAGVLTVVLDTGVPIIGMTIASRRPESSIGWLFLVAGAALGLGHLGEAYSVHALRAAPGSLPAGHFFAWLGAWIWTIPTSLLPFLFLLFPTGHLPSRRWRPLGWLYGFILGELVVSAIVLSSANWSHPFADPTKWIVSGLPRVAVVAFALSIFALPVALLSSFAAVAVRFKGAMPEERLQLKWFVTAAALVAVTFSFGFFTNSRVVQTLSSAALLLLYVAIGIAILKYRLYDIDVIIAKTVLYGGLAAFITVVYVVVVVVIGAFAGATEGLSLIATAIVAIAFQPARERVQRVANRLVYGKRATPYEVLSEFSERLGSYAGEELLPRMARLLAQGTGASTAVVWLRVDSELRPAASWPPGNGSIAAVRLVEGRLPAIQGATDAAQVRHQGEVLGALTLTKPPNEPLLPAEQKLLEDLAAQAGLVLRNFRLIEDLRASRQRLVAAQDEERRRLERNLHDGAQQQLVALAVRLKLARSLSRGDPAKADGILMELEDEVASAIDDLRDLARGIYPPLLADEGLAAALSSQARRASIPVTVEADAIARHPQEVEAAVYFFVLEALQNVAKYAEAPGARVRLREEPEGLFFSVSDDGRGFDPRTVRRGAGLQNMEDRLSALEGELNVRSQPGAGTTVEGWIPVGSPAPGSHEPGAASGDLSTVGNTTSGPGP